MLAVGPGRYGSPMEPGPHRALGATFLFAGLLHFLRPRWYEAIMPPYLPAHRALVYASGAAEMAGGAATLHPRTRAAGGWWLIATLLAIFPANIHVATHLDEIPGDAAQRIPRWLHYLRLPVQGVFVAWAWRATHPRR